MHTKTIGLVAHDARKQEMLTWVKCHAEALCRHKLVCTGTTGGLIEDMLQKNFPHLPISITRMKSGPLGGDQQIGAKIVDGEIDILIFLTDPMTTQPHDVDVKALVRLCTVYNIVLACTLSTADFVISSPLFGSDYKAARHDYSAYLQRQPI
ncbi:MAG: Methylglyoxal synthase [Desulfovibrio sp.]